MTLLPVKKSDLLATQPFVKILWPWPLIIIAVTTCDKPDSMCEWRTRDLHELHILKWHHSCRAQIQLPSIEWCYYAEACCVWPPPSVTLSQPCTHNIIHTSSLIQPIYLIETNTAAFIKTTMYTNQLPKLFSLGQLTVTSEVNQFQSHTCHVLWWMWPKASWKRQVPNHSAWPKIRLQSLLRRSYWDPWALQTLSSPPGTAQQ